MKTDREILEINFKIDAEELAIHLDNMMFIAHHWEEDTGKSQGKKILEEDPLYNYLKVIYEQSETGAESRMSRSRRQKTKLEKELVGEEVSLKELLADE